MHHDSAPDKVRDGASAPLASRRQEKRTTSRRDKSVTPSLPIVDPRFARGMRSQGAGASAGAGAGASAAFAAASAASFCAWLIDAGAASPSTETLRAAGGKYASTLPRYQAPAMNTMSTSAT